MLLWFWGVRVWGFFFMSRYRISRKTYKEVFFKVAEPTKRGEEGEINVCVDVYGNSD